ncbi:MAG: L-serine ammonia-lyase, iron-sulfur-dependent, subunit alpha [Spirochaetaceae bacterium]|nr:L-serine ammonia-lyase, iron-sulfur-dependent, subunit alpha [Spirochaetaceae bacterium]
MITYDSVEFFVKTAAEQNTTISALVLDDQAELFALPKEDVFSRMAASYEVMKEGARAGAGQNGISASGLSGNGGYKLTAYAQQKAFSGAFCANAIARAVALAEHNASMGKIVAAPTAGSCGILPAALITMQEELSLPDEAVVMALFTAGAFGMVIARQASISGAEGGCQAECGSAAAIAAAALVELAGGSPAVCSTACAIALSNQMGLVCDPIAGLVEVPCIVRNAGGVTCAITAAELALGGIMFPVPTDEVIGAMREVGVALPLSLRETAQGGLAATSFGRACKLDCTQMA